MKRALAHALAAVTPADLRAFNAAQRAERRQALVAAYGPRRLWPRCGARTRRGTPCQAPPMRAHGHPDGWLRPRNGRCLMHGGASTGPKTPEGRRRVGAAARARWDADRRAAGWIDPPKALVRALEDLVARTSRSRVCTGLWLSKHELRRLLEGRPEDPAVIGMVAEQLPAVAWTLPGFGCGCLG